METIVRATEHAKRNNLRNRERENTVHFRIPTNGHYCIALTTKAFSDYICDWIGSQSGCYILHSRILEEIFLTLQSDFPFDSIRDSDEEQSLLF